MTPSRPAPLPFVARCGPECSSRCWYTLLLAGSMIVLGSLGFWLVDRALWNDLDDMLRARTAGIESDLVHDVGRFGVEDAHEVDALGASLDIVRIWDRGGKLVYGREGVAPIDVATVADARRPTSLTASGWPRSGWPTVARRADHARRHRSRPDPRLRPGRAGYRRDRVDPCTAALSAWGASWSRCRGRRVAARSWPAGRSLRSKGSRGKPDASAPTTSRDGSTSTCRTIELGRLVEAFDAMIARLDGAFERQRRFTADASHELRTPLGIIRSQIDVALGRPRSAEYHARVLASVRDETDRLTRLTESLLTLARADDGEAIARHTVDCQDLVAEVGAHVAPKARDLGVHLSVQVGECPLVLAAMRTG